MIPFFREKWPSNFLFGGVYVGGWWMVVGPRKWWRFECAVWLPNEGFKGCCHNFRSWHLPNTFDLNADQLLPHPKEAQEKSLRPHLQSLPSLPSFPSLPQGTSPTSSRSSLATRRHTRAPSPRWCLAAAPRPCCAAPPPSRQPSGRGGGDAAGSPGPGRRRGTLRARLLGWDSIRSSSWLPILGIWIPIAP